jgi:hypothetical protein
MFKAGIVAGLTSAQSLVHDTPKDVNKECTTDHKERNSTTQHDQHETSTELTTGSNH